MEHEQLDVDDLLSEMLLDDQMSDLLLGQYLTGTAAAEQLVAQIICTSAESCTQKSRKRSVAAHVHPGNLLEFIGDQPGVLGAAALWKNLPPELEPFQNATCQTSLTKAQEVTIELFQGVSQLLHTAWSRQGEYEKVGVFGEH